MRYRVFHIDNGTREFPASINFPVGYALAATVNLDTLTTPTTPDELARAHDVVYQLTNHIDTDWTTNPSVQLTDADVLFLAIARAQGDKRNASMILRRRSTSVGDVIIDENGVGAVVMPFGFDPLPLTPDQLAAVRVNDEVDGSYTVTIDGDAEQAATFVSYYEARQFLSRLPNLDRYDYTIHNNRTDRLVERCHARESDARARQGMGQGDY